MSRRREQAGAIACGRPRTPAAARLIIAPKPCLRRRAGGVVAPPGRSFLLGDTSSAAARKRVAAGIPGNRPISAPRAGPGGSERVYPSAHLDRIEAKPWALSPAEPAGAELIGVGVDPGAIEAAPLRHLDGAHQTARLRGRTICPHQLGDPLGQYLDRLAGETNLLGMARAMAGLALVPPACVPSTVHR